MKFAAYLVHNTYATLKPRLVEYTYPTLKPRLVEHTDEHSDFLGMYQNRNSLRSNNRMYWQQQCTRVEKGPRRLHRRLRRGKKTITWRLSCTGMKHTVCWCKKWQALPDQRRVVWQGRRQLELKTQTSQLCETCVNTRVAGVALHLSEALEWKCWPNASLVRYSSCRYNERQRIDVTVVRRVRPPAESCPNE